MTQVAGNHYRAPEQSIWKGLREEGASWQPKLATNTGIRKLPARTDSKEKMRYQRHKVRKRPDFMQA